MVYMILLLLKVIYACTILHVVSAFVFVFTFFVLEAPLLNKAQKDVLLCASSPLGDGTRLTVNLKPPAGSFALTSMTLGIRCQLAYFDISLVSGSNFCSL